MPWTDRCRGCVASLVAIALIASSSADALAVAVASIDAVNRDFDHDFACRCVDRCRLEDQSELIVGALTIGPIITCCREINPMPWIERRLWMDSLLVNQS